LKTMEENWFEEKVAGWYTRRGEGAGTQ